MVSRVLPIRHTDSRLVFKLEWVGCLARMKLFSFELGSTIHKGKISHSDVTVPVLYINGEPGVLFRQMVSTKDLGLNYTLCRSQ